ncbi:hypothetical protein BDF22DRAFT_744624 [Syncephalis plumigaleata]|nr:hypothetical protein BDF22DRAFT_744624 [Syncephalis plumigaleata]
MSEIRKIIISVEELAPCVEYPVVTIVMEPGSVLLMSDRVRHRSRGNASRRTRRVYMVQYSSGIVLTEDPTANMPLALAVPVEHG